jgi:hypothetical protein
MLTPHTHTFPPPLFVFLLRRFLPLGAAVSACASQERLAKRIAHAKETSHFKLEHSRDDPINLYSSQPIEEADTLTPPEPRNWSTEDRDD